MVVYFTPVSFLMLTLAFFGFSRRGAWTPPEGFPLQGGVVLAFLGAGFTLLSLQQVVLNQFALDRAGLSMQLLSPLTDRELVVGKAAGGAILGASAALLCIVPAVIVAPAGSLWLWLAVGAAAVGAYLLMAPVAAILSTLFPKRADLSKLGRAGNPHAAAEIIGFLFYLALPLPPVVATALALLLFESPRLAFLLMAGWALVCLLLAWPLFRLAIWLLGNRRENIAMVVERG
jgi:hypothetical protein